MTDEEKAREWVRTNSGYSTKEFHGKKAIEAFLAGLEAGKDMAEADFATIAYIQGAERYKPKWHDLRKDPNDLPKEDCEIITLHKNGNKNIQRWKNGNWTNAIVIPVIAWCEIPTFTD